jgi:hypothetical protein
MSPFIWIGLAVLMVAGLAFTGGGVKGAKQVGRTRLMGAARFFLIGGVILCGLLGAFGSLRH